jgi:PqqD family protein of HPr-rel-A system
MTETRWQAADPAHCRAVTLDDLVALYHRPSGQTHILVEPLPQILEALASGPLTSQALLQSLTGGSEGLEALEARLAELVQTGLVEPV